MIEIVFGESEAGEKMKAETKAQHIVFSSKKDLLFESDKIGEFLIVKQF